jgi:hypothetical protein
VQLQGTAETATSQPPGEAAAATDAADGGRHKPCRSAAAAAAVQLYALAMAVSARQLGDTVAAAACRNMQQQGICAMPATAATACLLYIKLNEHWVAVRRAAVSVGIAAAVQPLLLLLLLCRWQSGVGWWCLRSSCVWRSIWLSSAAHTRHQEACTSECSLRHGMHKTEQHLTAVSGGTYYCVAHVACNTCITISTARQFCRASQ